MVTFGARRLDNGHEGGVFGGRNLENVRCCFCVGRRINNTKLHFLSDFLERGVTVACHASQFKTTSRIYNLKKCVPKIARLLFYRSVGSRYHTNGHTRTQVHICQQLPQLPQLQGNTCAEPCADPCQHVP